MCVNTAFHGLLILKGTVVWLFMSFLWIDIYLRSLEGGHKLGDFPACVLAVDKLFKETLVLLLSFVFSRSLMSAVTSVWPAQRV